jgi:hypothetical protein
VGVLLVSVFSFIQHAVVGAVIGIVTWLILATFIIGVLSLFRLFVR